MPCVFCNLAPALLIKESEHFYLLYDPYPLTAGHLLITSRLHYGCGGELEGEALLELEALKSEATRWLRRHFSHVMSYEHGRAGSCHKGQDCEKECHHMHLHLLPLNHDLHLPIQELLGRCIKTSYRDIASKYHSFGNYLYYQRGEEEGYFYLAKSNHVPPHFLRSLIATLNQTPDRANWQEYPENNLLQTSRALFSHLYSGKLS